MVGVDGAFGGTSANWTASEPDENPAEVKTPAGEVRRTQKYVVKGDDAEAVVFAQPFCKPCSRLFIDTVDVSVVTSSLPAPRSVPVPAAGAELLLHVAESFVTQYSTASPFVLD